MLSIIQRMIGLVDCRSEKNLREYWIFFEEAEDIEDWDAEMVGIEGVYTHKTRSSVIQIQSKGH